MKKIGWDEIIDHALRLLRGKAIDGYEIYLDRSTHFDAESKEGKMDHFQISEGSGMAVRILKQQHMGFSYTTLSGVSEDKLGDAVAGLGQVIDDAIGSAADTASDPCYDFAPPLEALPSCPPVFDGTMEATEEGVKIARAKKLETMARSVDPDRIRKVRKASYQEWMVHRTLINSNGIRTSYASTFCTASIAVVAEEGEEAEVGWEFDSSHFQSEVDVERIGREASRRALESLGGRKIPSGEYPVLLRRDVASEFLSLLAHAFKSDQVLKGKSPLVGKKGELCFSSAITIADDGLHPKGMLTSPVDEEGTLSQRTPLVVQGVLVSYLYDRYWANRERAALGTDVRSTGNGRRLSAKTPPGIGTSNLLIEPGSRNVADLLRDLDRGVLLEEIMGLHTVDPISGDFSLGCSGKWIERGKVVHPFKSVAVAGNLFKLFREVEAVGDDFRFVGGVGSPSLLVRSLKISGT